MKWQGANLRELSGEEFSAYGVSQADGGVALSSVVPGSPAAKAGFRDGDLIQAVNGRQVANIQQFRRVIGRSKGTVTLTVVRNQAAIEVKVTL